MTIYKFSKRSWESLEGVHPKLIVVVAKALEVTAVDFTVLEGLRTIERQETLFESGASNTMDSKHLIGRAVDLGAWEGGSISWHWPLYNLIAEAMLKSADMHNIQIFWGGYWKEFRDGPHFQLGANE